MTLEYTKFLVIVIVTVFTRTMMIGPIAPKLTLEDIANNPDYILVRMELDPNLKRDENQILYSIFDATITMTFINTKNNKIQTISKEEKVVANLEKEKDICDKELETEYLFYFFVKLLSCYGYSKYQEVSKPMKILEIMSDEKFDESIKIIDRVVVKSELNYVYEIYLTERFSKVFENRFRSLEVLTSEQKTLIKKSWEKRTEFDKRDAEFFIKYFRMIYDILAKYEKQESNEVILNEVYRKKMREPIKRALDTSNIYSGNVSLKIQTINKLAAEYPKYFELIRKDDVVINLFEEYSTKFKIIRNQFGCYEIRIVK